MTVNISGQVPGEQNNGLVDLEPQFLHERAPEPMVAIAVIERSALKFNDVKQEWSATIRFKQIEPLTEQADQKLARQLLESQYAARTGADSLPTELDLPEEPEADFDTPLEDQPLEDDEDRESEPDDDEIDGFHTKSAERDKAEAAQRAEADRMRKTATLSIALAIAGPIITAIVGILFARGGTP